jgi:hypothetical protein
MVRIQEHRFGDGELRDGINLTTASYAARTFGQGRRPRDNGTAAHGSANDPLGKARSGEEIYDPLGRGSPALWKLVAKSLANATGMGEILVEDCVSYSRS